MNRVAYILDGGFVTKKFEKSFKAFPKGTDLRALIDIIHVQYFRAKQPLDEIYRIFFYDCRPQIKKLINPVDGSSLDLAKKKTMQNNKALQDQLTRVDNFALRFGALRLPGDPLTQWKISPLKIKSLTKRQLRPSDLMPNFQQKGVDMRIGLDIASMASKQLVSKMVLITGDTDMVPAMKIARKEGVQVYLFVFDRVSPALIEHADGIIRMSSLDLGNFLQDSDRQVGFV